MSTAPRKTPIELYRLGVAALDRALGPVESIRLLRLLDPGSGDYTSGRRTRMDQDPTTVDAISTTIHAARNSDSPAS